jgi:heterotetrameric sarcosine oxidase gamma subunit
MPELSARSYALDLPRAITPAGLTLAALTPKAQLWLSGDPRDGVFAAAAASVLGPLATVGRIAGNDPLTLWQAPDRWLVVSETRNGEDLAAALGEALRGCHAAVSDTTDGLACFEVAGPAARRVIGQGTTFDLEPARFGPGQGVVTLFAGLRASLYCLAPERYRLHGEVASARFLWDWLTTAATLCSLYQ